MRGWLTALGLVASLAAAAPARADEAADGYCDHVEGVAAAEAALLMSPELFGSIGYLDQPVVVDAPEASGDDLRLTAGVRYRLSGLYEGVVTRRRATAQCRRHRALGQVRGASTYQALAARARVLDDALPEAEKLLAQAAEDLEQRRATAQDVTATRLRVDELRALAARTRAELGATPAPPTGASMARALERFYAADAEVERQEGRLRRARAIDVSVRFGYDKFLENDDEDSPYFAVLQVGVNLGWFLQGGANERAAAGRRRLLERQGGGEIGVTVAHLEATLATADERREQVGVLVDDVERQLAALRNLGGDAGRRYRQSLWFDWVKLKAEHAYLEAHVSGMREVLGAEAAAE